MITETVLTIAGLNAMATIAVAPALLLPRLYAEALRQLAEALREGAERAPESDSAVRAAPHGPRRLTRPAPAETHRAAA